MKLYIILVILITFFGCSSNESKAKEDAKVNPQKTEPKEVKILKQTLIGESNSKPFTSVNGEFYLVGKYINDCNKYFKNGIRLEVEPTRDPDGIKQTHYFTGAELSFGDATVDTMRVYSESDIYYIKTFMASGCKLEIEVIDIQ